jgi:AraC-like DNA-binding protein
MLIDVSPLERRRLFSCDAPRASHAEVAGVFCDHGLTWRPGRIHTAMSRLKFEQLEVFSLQYGAEVEVRPRAFEDFALIHLSLSGLLRLDFGDSTLDRRPGEAVLLGQQASLRMHWAERTRQLILKIPRAALLADAAIPPFKALDAMQSCQLRALLQALLYAASPSSQDTAASTWVTSLEQSVLMFTRQIILDFRSQPVARLNDDKIVARDQRRIDRLLAFVMGHLGAPITLEDMARAADLSPRALHLLCQRHLAATPMSVVRDMRLDAVRRQLRDVPERPITEIALDHGFGHLGRFAAYYRERFGELPMQTQRTNHRVPSAPCDGNVVPGSAYSLQ